MSPRDELLRQCLRYLLAHGVANLSLRPLAEAAGTSPRMLVYHFGSKEGLIAAVMDEVRAGLQASFARMAADPDGSHPMRAFWQSATGRRQLPYLRLLFEVQVLAIQNPARYARYLADTSGSWLTAIQEALPPEARSAPLATLCAAVIDGLLLEYLATRDLRRTSAALELFLGLLGQRAPHGKVARDRPRRNAGKGGGRK
jgi:AcrR family transcriptional regulator